MQLTNVDGLPGVRVDVADGKLRVQPPAPGTKLTLLGTTTSTSLDANEPLAVNSVPLAMRALRHINGEPSELSMGLAEAVAAGATNIEVVKVDTTSGEVGYSTITRFDTLEQTYDLLKLHPLDVVVPISAHADDTGLTGSSPEGASRSAGFKRQLADFCYQSTIEFNACLGVIGVKPLMQTAADEAWAGAPDETGVYFDDPSLAFVREWEKHLLAENGTLLDHSSETELAGHLYGSVETAPGSVSGLYDGWAKTSTGTDAYDRNQVKVDGGMYVSITAILARANNDERQSLANKWGVPSQTSYHALSAGAVGYAALMTRLAPHQATTNQGVPGYSAARAMPFTIAQSLLQARMVTMITRSNGFVVQSGVTAAHNGGLYTRSDYIRLSTVRITHAAIDIIRDQAEPHLGRPITRENLAILETEIASGLNRMKGPGAIQSFELSVSSTTDAQILGQATVDLSLNIGHELTRINANIQLQRPTDIS